MWSRRRLLLGGGAVAASSALLLAGTELQPSAAREPREPLRVLSPRSFAALCAVAEVVVPAHPPLKSPWELRVPERVDALLDAMPPGAGAEVHQALLLLESPALGAVLLRVPRPFSQLSLEGRARVLDSWRDSRFGTRRAVWKALCNLVKSAYFADRSVDAFVGYDRVVFPS